MTIYKSEDPISKQMREENDARRMIAKERKLGEALLRLKNQAESDRENNSLRAEIEKIETELSVIRTRGHDL